MFCWIIANGSKLSGQLNCCPVSDAETRTDIYTGFSWTMCCETDEGWGQVLTFCCPCLLYRRVREACMCAWTLSWGLAVIMWADTMLALVRGLICTSPGLVRLRWPQLGTLSNFISCVFRWTYTSITWPQGCGQWSFTSVCHCWTSDSSSMDVNMELVPLCFPLGTWVLCLLPSRCKNICEVQCTNSLQRFWVVMFRALSISSTPHLADNSFMYPTLMLKQERAFLKGGSPLRSRISLYAIVFRIPFIGTKGPRNHEFT